MAVVTVATTFPVVVLYNSNFGLDIFELEREAEKVEQVLFEVTTAAFTVGIVLLAENTFFTSVTEQSVVVLVVITVT